MATMWTRNASTSAPASRAPACCRCGWRLQAADQQVFDLEVLLDPVLGALTAEARLLHAAEGRDLGRNDAAVHAHHAGLHLLGGAEHAPDVARVEVAREAELGVVRHGDRLVVGPKTE